MRSLRTYIREVLVTEAVSIDPFALTADRKDRTFIDTDESNSRLLRSAYSGGASILKAGSLLVTSKRKGGGISKAAGSVKKNWRGAGLVGLIITGIAAGIGAKDPDQISEDEANSIEKQLEVFNSDILKILEKAKGSGTDNGIIYDLRLPATRDGAAGAITADQTPIDLDSHYKKIGKSISNCDTYEKFFTEMSSHSKSLSATKPQIDIVIDSMVPTTEKDSKKIEEIRKGYRNWAYSVLMVHTVNESLAEAMQADILAFEKSAGEDASYAYKSGISDVPSNTLAEIRSTDKYAKAREVLAKAGYLEESSQ